MKPVPIFLAPIYSIGSRAFYQEVGRHWKARSFIYLLVLLAVSWIPAMIDLHSRLSTFLAEEAPEVIRQIPAITIDDGRVVADVDQPYFILTTDPNEVFAIIDTTGEVVSLDGTTARLLLTESTLIARENDTETQVHDLSNIQHFSLDAYTVERWLKLIGTWGLILFYPFAVLGSYAFRIIQALFYSVIGLLLAKRLRCSLSYAGILSITIMAISPAVLFKTAAWMVGISIPYSWLIYFLISMGYVIFGLTSNQDAPSVYSSVVK